MIKWREYDDIFDTIIELTDKYKDERRKWKIIARKLEELYNIVDLDSENVRSYFKRERKLRGLISDYDSDIDATEEEIITENVRLAKQRQRFMDSNRIERKSFREYSRIENSIEDYNKELIKILKKFDLGAYTKVHDSGDSDAAGIFHFTDVHFNELVDLSINKADFSVLAKRCKKFVTQAKKYFNLCGVKNILFAMTGDMLNSDRRLDELLNQATNRSKALVLSVHIIKQMLIDLNEDFNVTVAAVTGNESRKTKDIGWSDIITSYNYDFDVYEFLRYLFLSSQPTGIQFLEIDDPLECVVEVGGQNVLMLHGHQLIGSKLEQSVQKIVGKYSDRGITVKFVIFGHLHSCRIGDTYGRGSSMIGANAYSDAGLHLVSKASQNIHIIFDENSRDSIRIDLQDVTDVEGYDIDKELEAYHAKSVDMLHKDIPIMKIVI